MKGLGYLIENFEHSSIIRDVSDTGLFEMIDLSKVIYSVAG